MDIFSLISIISAIITIGTAIIAFIMAFIKFLRKKRRLSSNQRKPLIIANSGVLPSQSSPKFMNVKNLGIVALIFLGLSLIFGAIHYYQTPKNLAQSATMLVHDLKIDAHYRKTNIQASQGIYIRPLTLFVLNEQKVYLDMFDFDTALHNALSQSTWLIPLKPREKLGTADIYYLRKQATCDNLQLASMQCNSLVADLINADSELTGEVRINKKQVNVDITLTKDSFLAEKIIAHATINFPKSLLPQETLEQIESLPNAKPIISKGNLEIEMSTSHGVHDVIYEHGEVLRLFIRTNQAAYIYLFVFDAKNRSTLLYPESKHNTPERQTAGQLFVLPDDGLPYSLPVIEPFGKTTLWAIAVTNPLQFPAEMDDTWFQADTLRKQVRELSLASSTNYAEAEIMAQTIGPPDNEESEDDDLDLDSLLE
ncbi:membrane protein [Beggiatoa sp. PS]|nr:membrane protein [Beggiatoa sp. PS]